MCGIVGYIGTKEAFPILIKGLRRLEYRGYDSAGVALVNDDGALNVYKTKGKVDNLVEYCGDKNISGTVGIAHTRWATHGEPSSRNAHPHYSSSKNLAIIHNGIIENYADLKAKLQAKGVKFESDTDTEVLVQLIEYIQQQKQLDLLTAVQVALYQVIGAYAIAVVDKRDPDQIIAARKQSPLVVGIGEDEFFLGSDASPIVEYTDKVVYLEDGNIAGPARREYPRRRAGTDSEDRRYRLRTDREGRFPALHAEGDLRAARVPDELHAWPCEHRGRPRDTLGPDRLSPPDAQRQARGDCGLWYLVARRPDRQAALRVAGARASRGGVRLGVPLSQPGSRQG